MINVASEPKIFTPGLPSVLAQKHSLCVIKGKETDLKAFLVVVVVVFNIFSSW